MGRSLLPFNLSVQYYVQRKPPEPQNLWLRAIVIHHFQAEKGSSLLPRRQRLSLKSTMCRRFFIHTVLDARSLISLLTNLKVHIPT